MIFGYGGGRDRDLLGIGQPGFDFLPIGFAFSVSVGLPGGSVGVTSPVDADIAAVEVGEPGEPVSDAVAEWTLKVLLLFWLG